MKKCAIRAEIALLLTNQIAGNAIDFKMNIINLYINFADETLHYLLHNEIYRTTYDHGWVTAAAISQLLRTRTYTRRALRAVESLCLLYAITLFRLDDTTLSVMLSYWHVRLDWVQGAKCLLSYFIDHLMQTWTI